MDKPERGRQRMKGGGTLNMVSNNIAVEPQELKIRMAWQGCIHVPL